MVDKLEGVQRQTQNAETCSGLCPWALRINRPHPYPQTAENACVLFLTHRLCNAVFSPEATQLSKRSFRSWLLKENQLSVQTRKSGGRLSAEQQKKQPCISRVEMVYAEDVYEMSSSLRRRMAHPVRSYPHKGRACDF